MSTTDKNWDRADISILKHIPITPDVDNDLAVIPKAILLDVDGTITYVSVDGVTCTAIPLAGKVQHRVSPKRVTACTASLWGCH